MQSFIKADETRLKSDISLKSKNKLSAGIYKNLAGRHVDAGMPGLISQRSRGNLNASKVLNACKLIIEHVSG